MYSAHLGPPSVAVLELVPLLSSAYPVSNFLLKYPNAHQYSAIVSALLKEHSCLPFLLLLWIGRQMSSFQDKRQGLYQRRGCLTSII